jgi:transposase-like protein
VELPHFLGGGRYERCEGESNHRNGFYPRESLPSRASGKLPYRFPRIARASSRPRCFLGTSSTKMGSKRT